MSQLNLSLGVAKNQINVPPELQGYIEPAEWNAIRKAISDGETEGCCIACAIEWAVCLVFAFPCVFCCHPCIAVLFGRGQVNNKVAQLNRVIFGGQEVVVVTSDYLIINASLLSGRAGASAGFGGSPVHAAAQVVNQQPQMAQASVINPVAAAPAPAARSMTVMVPQGATAGYTLKVTAPDGSIVSVVVPEGVQQGQSLTVQY